MERAWSRVDDCGRCAAGSDPRTYTEILFLPTRNLRLEKYTGAKLDAGSPGISGATGVDQVQP